MFAKGSERSHSHLGTFDVTCLVLVFLVRQYSAPYDTKISSPTAILRQASRRAVFVREFTTNLALGLTPNREALAKAPTAKQSSINIKRLRESKTVNAQIVLGVSHLEFLDIDSLTKVVDDRVSNRANLETEQTKSTGIDDGRTSRRATERRWNRQ